MLVIRDEGLREPKKPGVLLNEIVEVCPVCVVVCVSADQVEGFLTIIYCGVTRRPGWGDEVGQGVYRV